jgi:prepilin-type N-terminal cleavage/methylation domain-containing protein
MRFFIMKKMNKKGFTLIEMLVVIAIIAILVAIVVPTVSSATMKSKGAADAANLRTITAQAAVDYLENSKVGTYTIDLKTTGANGVAIAFGLDANDNLVAQVGTAKWDIEYFTYIAENGKASATWAAQTVTAVATE